MNFVLCSLKGRVACFDSEGITARGSGEELQQPFKETLSILVLDHKFMNPSESFLFFLLLV